MPGRKTPIITNYIYHVFNKGIDGRPTFTDKREYVRAITTIQFYQFLNPPIKLSKFLELEKTRQDKIASKPDGQKLVRILAYCLMPNHFHFLVEQISEKGISKFLGQFQNSFTRYFNTKNNRLGSLFLDQFKAVRVETDEQLLHLSRYIHLNPYTSAVVENFLKLQQYPWSSLVSYTSSYNDGITNPETVLGFFKNPKLYLKFLEDQKDYQKELHQIKHLSLEKS